MAAFKWVPGNGFVSEFEFTPLALSLGKIGRSRFPVRTVGPNGKAMLWETKVLDKLPPEWRA